MMLEVYYVLSQKYVIFDLSFQPEKLNTVKHSRHKMYRNTGADS